MASRDVLTVGNRLLMKRGPLMPGRLFLIKKQFSLRAPDLQAVPVYYVMI